MICPTCKAENKPSAEACFICGRALGVFTQGAILAERYEIEAPLGRGGMGMVYRAHDRMLDETVAIKVLRSEFANTADMAQRFRHELKLARRVSHRNVCRIHEYSEHDGVRFISMEYLEGTDIKEVLRARGPFAPEEAFTVAIQVADALQAIHDQGIIHRDLKTPNLMTDAKGTVRLMDFGIAKHDSELNSGGLTGTGQVMGTPEYMSPEQCRGERIDFRTDIYSLGIVIFELFTGQVPFRGDTPIATIYKHLEDAPPPDAMRGLPAPIVPVLERSLAKNRDERYATAIDLATALRRARDEWRASGAPNLASGIPQPAPFSDRRRDTRLDVFFNLILRRVGTLGTVLQEERTVAENVSSGGARVLTTMTGVSIGEILQIEEVGGVFKTRAEIRNTYVGKDHVRRLNLRFLDAEAPPHLVRIEGWSPTTPVG